MSDRTIFGAIAFLETIGYSFVSIFYLTIDLLIVRLVMRLPSTSVHRKWAIPWLVSAALSICYRIIEDVHVFQGGKWPLVPFVITRMFVWTESGFNITGMIAFWRMIREVLRQPPRSDLDQLPIESWLQNGGGAANAWSSQD